MNTSAKGFDAVLRRMFRETAVIGVILHLGDTDLEMWLVEHECEG